VKIFGCLFLSFFRTAIYGTLLRRVTLSRRPTRTIPLGTVCLCYSARRLNGQAAASAGFVPGSICTLDFSVPRLCVFMSPLHPDGVSYVSGHPLVEPQNLTTAGIRPDQSRKVIIASAAALKMVSLRRLSDDIISPSCLSWLYIE
jgi:hypothetical protein